jgi:hypothetical protein
MKTLEEQSEIVKQRLHYHFAKVGGGWNIEGMDAPFMKEFLNEVERLCALSSVVGRSEQLVCKCGQNALPYEAVSKTVRCCKDVVN